MTILRKPWPLRKTWPTKLIRFKEFKDMVNETGDKITEDNIAIFKTIESAAKGYSRRIPRIYNVIFGIKKSVKVYNDWMDSNFSAQLAAQFMQAPHRIPLVLKEMEKRLKFSDADKTELNALLELTTKISRLMNTEKKVKRFYEDVLGTQKLKTNDLVELENNINEMYEIVKSVVKKP